MHLQRFVVSTRKEMEESECLFFGHISESSTNETFLFSGHKTMIKQKPSRMDISFESDKPDRPIGSQIYFSVKILQELPFSVNVLSSNNSVLFRARKTDNNFGSGIPTKFKPKVV